MLSAWALSPRERASGLFVRLSRGVYESLVVIIRLGRHAEIFPEFRIRAKLNFALGCPGPGENLRVRNCHLGLQGSIARASVTLDGPHLIGVWKATDAIPAVLWDPGSV